MASLIFRPPFAREPEWQLQVNQAHPLARGLVVALPLNGLPYEAITGAAVSFESAPFFASSPGGKGLFTDGTDDGLFVLLPKTVSVPVTLLCVYAVASDSNVFDNTAQSDVPLMLRDETANYERFDLAFTNTAGGVAKFGAGMLDDTTGSGVGVSGNVNYWTEAANKDFVVVGVFPSTTSVSLYVNGALQATDPAVSARDPNCTRLYVGHGSSSSDSVAFARGVTKCALVWDRALSAEEIAIISANPWQLFMPPTRRYGLSAPAPATAFQPNAFQPNAFQIFGGVAGAVATNVNCTVGNLALGNVGAQVILTTRIGCTVGSLVLGPVNAGVQLATAVNTASSTMLLGSVAAALQLQTTIGASVGQLVLGGVPAAVALTTVINTTEFSGGPVSGLQLNGITADVQLATAINCGVGSLLLGGVPCAVEVQAATYINCSVGGLLLGGVAARVIDTTGINAGTGNLQLNGTPAAVVLPTVIACGVGQMTLGGVPCTVAQATTIACGVGSLTLGRVNAAVQLATAVAAGQGTLVLGAVPADVTVTEALRIDCGVGGLALGGVPAQVQTEAPPEPEPPRSFGGGGGPGQWIIRRKRVRVAIEDRVDSLLVVRARTTPYIRPLAEQIAAIVDAAADSARAVQRAHWTPARARVGADDEATDSVLVRVHVTDVDLLDFFDALVGD